MQEIMFLILLLPIFSVSHIFWLIHPLMDVSTSPGEGYSPWMVNCAKFLWEHQNHQIHSEKSPMKMNRPNRLYGMLVDKISLASITPHQANSLACVNSTISCRDGLQQSYTGLEWIRMIDYLTIGLKNTHFRQVAILWHVLGSTKIHFGLYDEAMMWVNSHLDDDASETDLYQLRQQCKETIGAGLVQKWNVFIDSVLKSARQPHLQCLQVLSFLQWPISRIALCNTMSSSKWCLKSHEVPMKNYQHLSTDAEQWIQRPFSANLLSQASALW